MFPNGVPQQSSTGAWGGGFRFSTQATSTHVVLSALGLTGYGSLASTANIELMQVENSTGLPDGLTKALRFQIGQLNQQWGIGVDAFSTLVQYGDVVVLGRIDGGSPPGHPAPGMNMSGTSNSTFTAEYVRARFKSPGFVGLQGLTKTPGTQFNNGEVTSTFGWGAGWQWIRLRIGNAGGGNKVRRIRIWDGAFADESTAWDWENTASNHSFDPIAAIGATAEGASGTLGVAFMSFSQDAAAQPAPGPAEIGPAAPASTPAEFLGQLLW